MTMARIPAFIYKMLTLGGAGGINGVWGDGSHNFMGLFYKYGPRGRQSEGGEGGKGFETGRCGSVRKYLFEENDLRFGGLIGRWVIWISTSQLIFKL